MNDETAEFSVTQNRDDGVRPLSTSMESSRTRKTNGWPWLLQEAAYLAATCMFTALVLTPLILNRTIEPKAPIHFVLFCGSTLYGLLGYVRMVRAALSR